MVKLRMLFMLSIAILCVSCTGTSKFMKPSETMLTPTTEKALVRFMRPSGMGYAINFNIWDSENVIGNSVSKSQFDYLVDPGKHLFVAVAENKVFLEAELQAGKTYYIITRIYPGVWKARVAFIAVNRGSEFWDKVADYEKELNKLQPDTVLLKEWEAGNKSKIKELLSQYEITFKKSEQWPKLGPEDGR